MTNTDRKRYIGFVINPALNIVRRDMITAINMGGGGESGPGPKIWLIVFEDGKGIVRVSHMDKDKAIKLLSGINSIAGMDVKILTIVTSGTIRTVKERMKLRSGKFPRSLRRHASKNYSDK